MPKFTSSKPKVIEVNGNTHDLVYSFRVSRVSEGNFKNLWRLEAKAPHEEQFVELVDADMLSTCIGKISYVFEQDGL